MMRVKVVVPNPSWPNEYEQEKNRLVEVLGGVILEIHHIGSTSVKGLAAKPIIDIIIESDSLEKLDTASCHFEGLGYEVKGEFGMMGRRYYRKGGDHRTHQIHAFKVGDPNIHRHIAFRNYLAAHPGVMREYQELKMKLAKACNNDIDVYCDGKDSFIKYYEAKAMRWESGIMKLKRASIELSEYDYEWPSKFEAERDFFVGVIGQWLCGGVQHVGSTSVPGLIAKPVIDIMFGVKTLEESRQAIDVLVKHGYVYFPYKKDVMHWFCKPSDAFRTHHLHLIPYESPLWNERIKFRNLLLSDKDVANEYYALKKQLAVRYREDRESYTREKGPFIQNVLNRATNC